MQLEFHRQMGHAYLLTLQKMIWDGVVTGVDLEVAEVEFCEVCQQAKQTQAAFPKECSSPCATKYGQRVHTDVWGKSQVHTWDGKEYFITFLDESSDKAFVSLMCTKSEALSRYRAYEAWAKMHRGVTEVQFLQSNRGGEYTSAEFNSHLAKHGTLRNLTTYDSPQSNGKAERLDHTLAPFCSMPASQSSSGARQSSTQPGCATGPHRKIRLAQHRMSAARAKSPTWATYRASARHAGRSRRASASWTRSRSPVDGWGTSCKAKGIRSTGPTDAQYRWSETFVSDLIPAWS